MTRKDKKILQVSSEIGRLRRLLVHSPDSGVGKVVPSKAQDWLFEDIVHLDTMRGKEYDYYTKILLYFLDPKKIKGCLKQIDAPESNRDFYKPEKPEFFKSDKVIELEWLLAEILENADIRLKLVASVCAVEGCSYETQNELLELSCAELAKTKPVADIQALYDLGQRDFGENYVQELGEKQMQLPQDIRWHFIGHLQSNKVKYIAPFVHLIHGVDSYKLLLEIDKQGKKFDRVINCLLQVHISQEETKFGFNEIELLAAMDDIHKYKLLNHLQHVEVIGLMGMASFSNDLEQVRKEFTFLKMLYDHCAQLQGHPNFSILSMGMSGDYRMAITEGSNMVRIGSLLFGARP